MTIFRRAARATLAAVVLAVVLAGSAVSIWAIAPGPSDQPRYTVASSKDIETVVGSGVVVSATPGVVWLSEKLTLVGVGGLLLGLAAAVRRTA